MINPQALADYVLKTDVASFGQWAFDVLNPNRRFVLNPYYLALCHQLRRVLAGEERRLLITLPPRSGKSELVTVAFTAFLLGHTPEKRIVCASYAADLAEKFQLATRQLMETERYRSLFPRTKFSRQQATKGRFLTTRNGGRMATSVDGKATGFGGDVIILDDIMRASDAKSEGERARVMNWVQSTLPSRFDDPKSGIMIVVAQRLHVDDLPAALIAQGGWTHLDLPAVAWRAQTIDIGPGRVWHREPGDLLMPERLGLEELARLRGEIGPADFEAQYNQRPSAPEGRLFRLEWFNTREDRKWVLYDYEAVIQSWDTALVTDDHADFTACVTLGLRGPHIHVLDVFRERLGFTDQLKSILALRKKYRANLVVIEKSGSGHMLWEEINRRQGERWLLHNNATLNKIDRAEQQTAKLEAGLVYLPATKPWLDTFRKELAEFPRGKHDDIVDAFTQGLRLLDHGRREIAHASYYRTQQRPERLTPAAGNNDQPNHCTV